MCEKSKLHCVVIELLNVIKLLEYCLYSGLTVEQDFRNMIYSSILYSFSFWSEIMTYLISCARAILLALFTTLGPQTAVMTQVILLSELIYTVEALMTWIWWLVPFVLQWDGKSVEQHTYDLASLITLQPPKGAFCLSTTKVQLTAGCASKFLSG